MNSANKENINRKRKRTESFDGNNYSNENTLSKKILKLDKNNNGFEEEIYFDNKITGSESMKILANNQVNINVKTSNFIGSINKNDVLTLIWKTNFDYLALVEKSKKIMQQYISKRGDLWELTIFYDKQTHNIVFRIKVNEKYSENQQYKYSECYGLEFTADITMQVNSPIYRSISVNNNSIAFSKENDFSLDFLEDISGGLIENNSEINLIFEISITKNYLNLINNERKKIGYIGMINEAMTCYMNSMIQTLNIFGAFKKAVFDIPTKEDEYNSISLSLQRLFYDLLLKETPVSTDKLIMSFGWGREQMNMQHDVQEFNLLLGDLMERKMKGTPGEGTFSGLFEGKLINYIECFNVDYKSEKEERFTDLQLTVKGCKNIYQSFDMYISEDILDNDDKYFAEGYGKQKAKKGIKFLKCPNILILQLKRFEYNQKREAMVKINEYFEFNEELNLGKYMYNKPNEAQDPNENLYSLHSVVVHKGSPNSGHYYAYIKPTIEDNWIQFNDEVVKPADKYEVFDNNFGGANKYFKLKPRGEISETNYSFESNAYILVYVKKAMRRNILDPLKIENIPKQIKERFDNDLMSEVKEQIKRKRASENIMLQIFSPEVIKFFDNIGLNKSLLDLSVDKPLILDFRRIFKINVPRFFTFTDLLNFISNQTNIPINEFMIFEFSTYQKDNLIKRSDFTLKRIKPEDYGSLIEIYTKNHKQEFPLLFLYTEKNYNILKLKPQLLEGTENNQALIVEDYPVTSTKNSTNGIIYIPSKMNLLQFNGNVKELNFANEENQIFSPEGQNSPKLIFLKLFLPNNLLQYLDLLEGNHAAEIINKINNYSENYSLRIIDVFDFNYNKEDSSPIIIANLKAVVVKKLNEFLENIKSLNTQVIEYFSSLKIYLDLKEDFSFITERTCLSDYSSDKLSEDISADNVKEILEKNDGIILIPSSSEDENSLDQSLNILNPLNIKKELESYFNKLYIDLFCLNTSLPLYDKMQFNIKEITDEKIIKQKILEKIKEEKLFKLIFIIQNHFIITANQETFSAQNFIEKIDLSYFEIINNRDNNGKTINMYKEIPIAKFINYTEMRIDVSFSYIPKASLSEFKNFEVALFDKDSNKITLLSCVLPRKIKRSKEIVEFIAKSARINMVFEEYNNDLFRSNSQFISKINVNNSFFILQHPRDNFIFHFITDENADVFKFEGKAEFKYRLQMFDEVFIEKIHNPIYMKVYVKVNIFSNSKVKVDPLIVYLEKMQTNFELKLEVFRSLENNRSLNKALSPNYSNVQEFLQNEMNFEKIKFFKFSVSGGKYKKSTNLSAFKEDEYLENIFKGERIFNLVVEIALNNLSC